MMIDAGLYDELCTLVRERTEAQGVMVVVLGGRIGNGFSVQGPVELNYALPSLLRQLADDIERALVSQPRA